MKNLGSPFLHIVIMIAFVAVMNLNGTAQTVLYPTDDSYAHKNANASNYGDDTLLYSINNTAGTTELHIYMKFDISEITEPIESAILRLFVFESPTPDYRKVMTVSDDSWDEMSITWDNKPAHGDSIGYIIPNKIGKWVAVEIGDYVSQEKTDGIVSLALVPKISNGWLRFKSTQAVENRPELVINPPEGYGIDNISPTVPTNLSSHNITPFSFILSWDKSTDNEEVSYYKILKKGSPLGISTENYFSIDRQSPGSSVEFSVIAFDESENASAESEILTVNFPEDISGEGRPVNWNKDQAIVLANGDLFWKPEPFEYIPGTSVRYIDYENGDDTNDGQSTSTAWKHHPWDPAATSNAAGESGTHTYVFKKGVVYRGTLSGNESGTPLESIQLTVDPAWGEGEAMFYGSIRIENGWTQCDAASAPNIPNPELVYYIDLDPGIPETKTVVEVNSNEMKRLNLARIPNWEITDSIYPMEQWWRWTGITGKNGAEEKLIDKNNLTQTDENFWVGGTIWSRWNEGAMGTVWNQEITSFDPETQSLKVEKIVNQEKDDEGNVVKEKFVFGGKDVWYYIENLPQLLDTTMEYWFDKDGDFPGRLYIRLSDNRDPNTTTIEVATNERLITLTNQNYVEISGLSFAFTTSNKNRHRDGEARNIDAVINLDGYCHHIHIHNCSFKHVNAGISVANNTTPLLNANNIVISDNQLQHISDQPITFSESGGKYMEDIFILRNKVYDNGFRQLNRWYSAIPAISAYVKTGVVAGNFVDYSWGAGIYLFWGKGTSDTTRIIPFIKGFVYHNRVENTLLGTTDWGGIEHWQGGPAYYYNNYSKNAHGWSGDMANNTWNPWGFPFYFDGSFKLYAFNNIAVSPFNSLTDPSKRNRAGYQMVLGTFATLANNTSHNFFNGIISQANDGGVPAYNAYLGNVLNKTSRSYFNQTATPTSLIPFDSYANNIFSGSANLYWENIGGTATSFDAFKNKLEDLSAQSSQLGWDATYEVLPNADNNNFLPAASGEAIDRGVKFFAPMALKAVVGEWNFYIHQNDSSLVAGENFYMTKEYEHRGMYYEIPKNHLKVENVTYANYVKGDLEDWTKGALEFDGSETYCMVENNSGQQQLVSNDLDMTTNNFILEVYLKTTENSANSTIISKYTEGSNGYRLGLNGSGQPVMELLSGGNAEISASGTLAVNDDEWHHILAEVSRNAGINIYIDGELSNGSVNGSLPNESLSLENNADFYIGRDESGNYFKGVVDFVRISKGNLDEALTTIDELYKWQFDGPFLYDFAGKAPIGKRDAGALETGEKLCDLMFYPSALEFEAAGGSSEITITGSSEIELLDIEAAYITGNLADNTLTVGIPANPSTEPRTAVIEVFGCNETHQIGVLQKGQPTNVEEQFSVVNVYPNPAKDFIIVSHNYSETVHLKILDINGRHLIQSDNLSTSEKINISDLRPGIYFIELNIHDAIKIEKLIVK